MRSSLAVALVTLLIARANANPEADAAVAEAEALAKRGDFVTAAVKYRAALRAAPRPELMCNVGVAYYKAKDLPRARRYLEECVAMGTSLDAAFMTNVQAVIKAVDGKLASGDYTPVDLIVEPINATTRVDGGLPFDELLVGSRRAWFPYGRYKLTIHAEGYVDRIIELDAKSHDAIAQRIVLERAPVVETGSAGSAAPPETGSGSGSALRPPPPPPPQAPESLPPPSLRPAIITTSVTVTFAIVAVAINVIARGKADEAERAASFAVWDDIKATTRRLEVTSWAFGAAAGVGLIATSYLWYRVASAPRVEVSASGSGGAIAISGRF